ncbi:hypothetical protein HNQ93_003050 [Hymenobacter luteus]|uniref:DUF4294 domain-containing protein n=2 Tax=Hymenobacter TaxID=89966 RepID=A0A7W9T4A9_9BACT|nr:MULTISPECIES: hypothetical protein [Hymenobacter]MBB4603286.1 hypothetical protein [Hymenobacter latericoloratus]MBB6060184.1 hypothetical protein [Hymenobacter luteus]
MKQLLLLAILLTPFVAAAQVATPVAELRLATAVTDTAEYRVNRYVSFIPGTLQLVDGRAISGYMPVPMMYPGMDYPFIYYLTHPNATPTPPKQVVRVDEVQSMIAGSHYFEPMRLAGEKKVKILAERVVNGPVELFLQAEQQSVPLAIPLPGVMAYSSIPYKNSHFFVRREGRLIKVDRGRFYMQMSQYLSDYPGLAKMIAKSEKGYHYPDLIRIVTNYNRYKSNLTGSGQ